MRTNTCTVKRRRRVVYALATGAAMLAAAAPAPAVTYVYVTSGVTDYEVLQYSADSSGALSPLAPPSVATGQFPYDVAVSPNARWAYVAIPGGLVAPGGVAQFDLGPGGLLAAMTPPTVDGVEESVSIAVSPDSGSVYAANDAAHTVSQYDVGSDGTLSPKDPATITLDPSGQTQPLPQSIAISPDSRSVYVTTLGIAAGTPDLVYQFDVGTGGALSPKNPPSVPADGQPAGLAVSPDGRSVYVANYGLDTVSHYAADADGALALERSIGAGDGPGQAVVSPSGESLYVTNGAPGKTGSVWQYDVASDGTLSFKDPRKVPSGAGSDPTDVAVSPDGGSVYVIDHGLGSSAGALYQFSVGSDGTLSPKDPASLAAGTRPGRLAVSPAFATAEADLLTGTAGDDRICGLGGSDTIKGLGGDDKLHGDSCGGRTSASSAGFRSGGAARAGHDRLLGGAGRDRLYGGAGKDRLRGGRGRDLLHGGPGRDLLRGGPGRDRLHVRGGGRDRVHCGDGRDTVRVDKRDTVRRCEHIIRRSGLPNTR